MSSNSLVRNDDNNDDDDDDNNKNIEINSNICYVFEYVDQEVDEDNENDGNNIDDENEYGDIDDDDADFLLEDHNEIINDPLSDQNHLNNINYIKNDRNHDDTTDTTIKTNKTIDATDTNCPDTENEEEYLMEFLIEEEDIQEENINIKTESVETVEQLSNDEVHNNDNDLYHCSSCDIRFSSVTDHINLYHKKEEVMIETENEDSQKIKLENNQTPKKCTRYLDTLKCKECNSSFDSVKSLSAHMAIHRNKSISTKYLYQNKINEKTKKYIPKPKVPSVCEICNTLFNSGKSLKLHSRMHEISVSNNLGTIINNSKMFYCELCKKSFDRKFEEMHLKSHVSANPAHVCSTCNKRFSTDEHLLMHLNAHSDPREFETKASKLNIRLPYPCQYCGKEFSRPHEKVKHERIHTGEKPYSCDICGKTFRVSYCLVLHKRTHTDDRPYVCPHCNKRYKAQSVYNHHLMTHSSVRGYQCPFCPKSFKTAVQLSGHKNSHTKPFTCTECNRPFATLFAVKAHIESHKRINHNLKHSCKICGASYARGFALKDHIKEQHPDCDLNGDDADDLVAESLNNSAISSTVTTAAATSSNIMDNNYTEFDNDDNGDDDDDDDNNIIVPVTTLNYFDVIDVVGADNEIDDQEEDNIRIEDVTTNDGDIVDNDNHVVVINGEILELNDFLIKETTSSSGGIVTEEVTISEIEHYENEEVVTDWMMK